MNLVKLVLLTGAFLSVATTVSAQNMAASPGNPETPVAIAPPNQSIDYRELGRMPRLEEIPRLSLSPAQLKAECMQLFGGGRTYTMRVAEQRPGVHKLNWPKMIDLVGQFSTKGTMTTGQDGRPLCTVSYTWKYADRYVTSDFHPTVDLDFDGFAVYRQSKNYPEGSIFVKAGSGLLFTRHFYPRDKEKNVTLHTLHIVWGTYSPQ